LTLQQHVHLDFAVLVTSLLVVDIALSVEVGNDDNAFFVVVVVEQPSSAIVSISHKQHKE
jgi:hypothetical protein